MPTVKANLNYFLALFITSSMLALWFVAPFFAMFFLSIGADLASIAWSKLLAVVIVFIVIIFTWKRNGTLSPSTVKPGTENRYRVGNVILAIANAIVGLSLLISTVGFFFITGFGVAIGFIIAGALLLAVPVNIAGIICVETSRLRKPAAPVSSKSCIE